MYIPSNPRGRWPSESNSRMPNWTTPMTALMAAILCMRDLPAHERAIWRDVFRHYVFEHGDDVAAHIPEAARRMLGPLDDDAARRLRAMLLKRLNR